MVGEANVGMSSGEPRTANWFGPGLTAAGVALNQAALSSRAVPSGFQLSIKEALAVLALLCIVIASCRLCRCYCCRRRADDNAESAAFHGVSSVSTPRRRLVRHGLNEQHSTGCNVTPTIILLPHGRMLVVDGTIFTQLQTDNTGKYTIRISVIRI